MSLTTEAVTQLIKAHRTFEATLLADQVIQVVREADSHSWDSAWPTLSGGHMLKCRCSQLFQADTSAETFAAQEGHARGRVQDLLARLI